VASSTPTASPRVLGDVIPGARVRDVLLVVGFAGLIALSALVKFPLPGTTVPFSGQTFAVLAGAIALGASRATAGSLLYLGLGVVGVPWFTGAGPHTIGYIVGFVVASALVGAIASRGFARSPGQVAAAMAVGNVVIWILGAAGLALVLGFDAQTAIAQGVVPFLLGDAVKLGLAVAVVPILWKVVGDDRP
jgi:biotin transport system substrate-specific component